MKKSFVAITLVALLFFAASAILPAAAHDSNLQTTPTPTPVKRLYVINGPSGQSFAGGGTFYSEVYIPLTCPNGDVSAGGSMTFTCGGSGYVDGCHASARVTYGAVGGPKEYGGYHTNGTYNIRFREQNITESEAVNAGLSGSGPVGVLDGAFTTKDLQFRLGAWQFVVADNRTGVLNSSTVLCYGTNGPAIPTPTPSCNQAGQYKSLDVFHTGAVSAGDYTANEVVRSDGTHYILDFVVSAPVGGELLEGYNAGQLAITLDDPGALAPGLDTIEVSINDTGVFGVIEGEGAGNGVAVMGPGSTVTIRAHADIKGRASVGGEKIEVIGIKAKLPMAQTSANASVICEGGMEQYPISDYWDPLGEDFGRLNRLMQNPADGLLNGAPACQAGHQVLGWYANSTEGGRIYGQGEPIMQEFDWSGGPAQWKFRVRGYSAWVYIKDTAGSIVAQLFGDGTYAGGQVTGQWQLKTGSLDLDEGHYFFVMDTGPAAVIPFFQYIAYDDVAMGQTVSTECDEAIDEPPLVDTPTPSPTTNLSPTPSQTYLPTRTRTVTITSSVQPSQTRTATITTTARPTRTLTTTTTGQPTKSSTPPPATATRTKTPYGTPGGPEGPNTLTPNPLISATPNGTPGVQSTSIFGDLPPITDGNPGEHGENCDRPVNPWSLSWWVDYEFCRLFYAVSWQPRHSATLSALPALANDREPLRSVARIQVGIVAAQTEIAGALATDPNGPTVGQYADPNTWKAQANGPWNGGPFPKFGPEGNTGHFTTYCNAKVASQFGSYIKPGFCLALNILREVGALIWFQVAIDILFVWGMIRSTIGTIRFFKGA